MSARRWLVRALLLGALGACAACGEDTGARTQPPAADAGDDTDAPDDVGANDGADADAPDTSDPDTDDTPWTFEALAGQYGIITTIAGTGLEDAKGGNGWRPTFEGARAVEVELSRPHIAVGDDDGNVYIADKDAHGIRRVSPDGTLTTVAGTNVAGDDGDGPGAATSMRLSQPNGLWVRGDGVFYVLDLGNGKIRKVANGQMTTLFDAGTLGAGRGLWVSPDEDLAYAAAGTRLLRWTPTDGVTTLADGFVSLGNLHVRPDGTVLVTDRDGHRAYAIGPDGDKQVIAGNGTPDGGGDGDLATTVGLDEVRGIWAHPRGGFFLATHKGGQVWFVDPDGVIHLFVDGDNDDTHAGDGQPFDAPGPKISEPRAVTMDPQGNVLITESDFGFIRRVERLR